MDEKDIVQDVVEGAQKAQRQADDINVGGRDIIFMPHCPSLRDQFAMAALTGLLAGVHPPPTLQRAAGEAYRVADAMMEERNRGQETFGGVASGVAGGGMASPMGTRLEPSTSGEGAVQKQAWPENRRGSPEHD